MKKIIGIILSVFMMVSVFAVDFELRLMPRIEPSLSKPLKLGFGGQASLDIVPLYLRGRDSIFVSLQGGLSSVSVESENTVFDNFNFYNGGIGLGYTFRFMDRLSVAPEINFGGWSLPAFPDKFVEDLKRENPNFSDKDNGTSGLYAGGSISVNYYLLPELSAFANLGFQSNFAKSVVNNYFAFGIGVKYNFTKGLTAAPATKLTAFQSDALFPVFYSRYNDNNFGSVTFTNGEPNDISDVEIQVMIEQYMSNPKTVKTIDYIACGEEFSADLTAFLNENILESVLGRKVDATIIVNYKSLGKKMTYKEVVELQALSRNSMSWEDDRRAAAFVSGKDAAALQFARQIASIIKKDLRSDLPVNYQYAAAIFGALKAYGINYVIDPASAFTDNVGSASIDFLQFPYQTLLYHGGDCDDLTILNCSLLEALGVPTAFITVPGHIYMAFDAGCSAEVADAQIGKGKYILKNGQVWVPVEVTVSQDTFRLALSIGLREWKKYESEAAIIPLKYAWLEYKPVSIPESDISLQMPSREIILKGYKDALK